LIGFFLALLIVSIVGEATLRFFVEPRIPFYFNRIELLAEGDYSKIHTEITGINDELGIFRKEISPLIKENMTDLEKALIIKEWVMNQASKIGADIDAGTPYGMLSQMRKGKGAACGNMALVYLAALSSVDTQARLVQLMRSSLDRYDTHVTVEVWTDNDWVVIDPTFNCYFLIDSEMASAEDLHKLLLKNENPEEYVIVYGNGVNYPAQLEKYYVDPLTLYNEVFIARQINDTFIVQLPLFGYFFANRYVYLDFNDNSDSGEIKIIQGIIFMYHFVFPITAFVSFIALIILIVLVKKTPQNNIQIQPY
jgi:hypothetical protein